MVAAEQSVVLQQIGAAVNDIDSMTQQNASMVQETTAISFTLSEGADLPSALVGRFKLNRRAAPPAVIGSRAGASALRQDILAHARKTSASLKGIISTIRRDRVLHQNRVNSIDLVESTRSEKDYIRFR